MNPITNEQIDTNVCLPWGGSVEVDGMEITQKAERDATRLLRATFRFGVPVEPVGIAEELGVRVREAELDEDILGALLMKPGEDPKIILNQRDSVIRRRLTCAYEMGHYVRRSAETNEYGRVDRRKERTMFRDGPEDVYAREFAACLLMPREDVRTLAEVGMDDLEMALRLVVSREAIQLRLERLGLRAVGLRAA